MGTLNTRLHRSLVVLSALGFANCGDDQAMSQADASPDATPVDCSLLTYQNFGQAFMADYCLECHHSELSGLARKDAPPSINFETYTLVSDFAISIKAIAGTRRVMPPSFAMASPTLEERMQLVRWVDCGVP